MYADDVKLCLQYIDPAQGLALQSDLNAFQTWCMDNTSLQKKIMKYALKKTFVFR